MPFSAGCGGGMLAASMPKRIIPVSSGKGGVGKTTFAVNFALALSERAPTVLVDLDTATSSVRGAIGAPIRKDLYHFDRKGEKLSDCITRLDDALDHGGRFRQFGFVAGPKHYLEELTNPSEALRRRLATEINALPADYVVLDLRAGIDANVLDFLPFTNSGVLVFTPQLPQATAAAADVVKGAVFRLLRAVFGERSEVWTLPGWAEGRELVHEILARAEDAYDDSVPNLDSMMRELTELLGDQPFVRALSSMIADFRVHYVLNEFNGVEESHDKAIGPFVRNLASNVSTRLDLTQLGWIVHDWRVHRANCDGRPVFLGDAPEAKPRPAVTVDPIVAQHEALRSAALGIDRRSNQRLAAAKQAGSSPLSGAAMESLLGEQLDSLKTMFNDRRRDTARENFSYCVFRALSLMQAPRLKTEFGMSQIVSGDVLVRWLLKRLPTAAVSETSEAAVG